MNYSVKAAALATGVAESRLRTWERRYGVPSPTRSANGRRTYSEDDLQIIRRMAALASAGVPAAEAAKVALSDANVPRVPSQVVTLDPLAEEIARAARAYDERAVTQAVRSAQAEQGWLDALDTVIFPAMRLVGQDWSDDILVTANEHFATEIIRRQICTAVSMVSDRGAASTPTVLLACPEGERHDLGLLALSLLLLERGAGVVYLGADVPIADLARAAAELRPDAICMAATLPVSVTSVRRSMRALLSLQGGPRLFAGGPALEVADGHDVPAVLLPTSLGAAAGTIVGSK